MLWVQILAPTYLFLDVTVVYKVDHWSFSLGIQVFFTLSVCVPAYVCMHVCVGACICMFADVSMHVMYAYRFMYEEILACLAGHSVKSLFLSV